MSGLIGTRVIALGDDRPCPLVGIIVSVYSDDVVSVRWYDWRGMGQTDVTTEYLDELVPRRDGAS